MSQMTKEQAIKKLKKEYHKKWRDANKDKIKAYKQRYWEKKAEELLKAEEQQSEV